jgi:hypothetical protein
MPVHSFPTRRSSDLVDFVPTGRAAWVSAIERFFAWQMLRNREYFKRPTGA